MPAAASSFPQHAFWDFSLELYAREDVPEICLGLQDTIGVDVNIAFFCLWWSHPESAVLDQDSFDSIIAAAVRWNRDVVLPTRVARRAAKAGAPDLSADERSLLYKTLLGIEIEVEHAEQIMLARAAEGQMGTTARTSQFSSWRAARNLALYRKHLRGPATGPVCTRLGRLISICFEIPDCLAVTQLVDCGFDPG